MLVSYSWLKKYVDIPVDADRFVHDLTMLGLKVEGVESHGVDDERVVVGEVQAVAQHPDADRLRVCTVTTGGEPVEIVCGAANVAAGQRVPVATIGAKLPNGLKIKKSKLRGVTSHGMICSEAELGVADEADGIMVLPADSPVGTPVKELLGADLIMDVEITPNRPDQLGHVGVARETAALYDGVLKRPLPPNFDAGAPDFSIEIDNADDCYRYVGRLVRGVTVGPSPQWLKRALESVGVNSINNVVDVTNYVMMESGQPLHAFDQARLKGRIGVRRARAGETLVALNEEKYTFTPQNLLITDDDEPVAVAGVIGGNPTAVTTQTKDIFLECAAFNPRVIREGRKLMAISTDASYRFERGSDREICRQAADRATELLCEICGGTAGPVLDEFPTPWKERRVTITKAKTRRLIGVGLGVPEIRGLLERLQFETVSASGEDVVVRVPSWRADIIEEADLIEEVARLYGYDRIGTTWRFRTSTFAQIDPFDQLCDQTSDHLVARGFSDIMISSFTDGTEVDLCDWPADDVRAKPIKVKNPLTTFHEYLRTSLLPGAAQVVRHNFVHGQRTLKLFSIGKVFLPTEGVALPNEPTHLIVMITQPNAQEFWREARRTSDLSDVKAEVEVLIQCAGIDPQTAEYSFDPRTGAFTYEVDGENLAEGGIVPRGLAELHGFEQPVWFAIVDLETIFSKQDTVQTFKSMSDFPASKRDLSLVAPVGVDYLRVEKTLVKHAGRLLESVQVFDVFRGESIGNNTAYGVRLVFRADDKTLTDDEIDGVVNRIVRKLQAELDVTLRSS